MQPPPAPSHSPAPPRPPTRFIPPAPRTPPPAAPPTIALTLLLALSTACGINMRQQYDRMRPALLAHDYPAALHQLAAAREPVYGERSRLLYEMDAAMLLHLAGQYAASNAALERAKELAEALWTESVSAHAEAWLSTDNALPYAGEDFEHVQLYLIGALNYLALQRPDEAQVEARQVTALLARLNDRYAAAQGVYRDDALARWLSGKLAEQRAGGEAGGLGDAWIDYRRALQIYTDDYGPHYGTPVPRQLVRDGLRVLAQLGRDFAGERQALQRSFPNEQPSGDASAARVVLLHLFGEAPLKVDAFWTVYAGSEVVRVAYPRFVARPTAVTRARVRVVGGAAVDTEIFEDITAIAAQNLADHMGRIQARATARAVAKYVAGRATTVAGERRGDDAGAAMAVLGTLWNFGHAVAEQADKRSWSTLPAGVGVAEVVVPPGEQVLDVSFLAANGGVVERAQIPVTAVAGDTRFVSYRTLR